jgi:protein involved in polysaccharide export with SLBB domain
MLYKTLLLCSLLVFNCLGGCSNTKTSAIPPSLSTTASDAAQKYILQPGDNVDIKFYYNPELNENVTIRPDGRISLQLIDEITAAGLTPAQLDDALTKAYAKQLKRPVVTVILRTFEGQKIYVGGEVKNPQVLNIPGKITALQAIINAGSFNKDAKLSSVIIMSRGPDNRPIVRKVDLKKALNGEATEDDYLLKPFDIVYVPKTELAQADEFMAHIYNFIPRNVYVGFSYELHKEPTKVENTTQKSTSPPPLFTIGK